jgi:hypothetical protein
MEFLRSTHHLAFILPIDPLNSWRGIEMSASAQDGEVMLAAECRNPQVVGRNGLAHPLQLQADGGVVVSGLIVDVEHTHCSDPLPKPALVVCVVPGLCDSKPVLA